MKHSNRTSLATDAYGSLSRRIGRTVTTSVPAGSSTVWVYDGWNPLAEYSGSPRRWWAIERDSTFSMLYDGNCNVTEYIDNTGTIAAHFEYDAFGKTVVKTGPKANAFEHQFSTKPLDATSGLHYYGYRYYDATSGRWINRDPIEEQGGYNLYGFVGNSATNYIDVLGLASTQIETTCGWKFDKCNPSREDILNFLRNLPIDCKIKTFEINGHGHNQTIELNLEDMLTAVNKMDGSRDVEWDGVSFSGDLNPYLDGNSVIHLDGCHTGCEGPFNGDENNIAKVLSKKVPGFVTGFKGSGIGNAVRIPFTQIGDNNVTSSVGDRRYYKNGNWAWPWEYLK